MKFRTETLSTLMELQPEQSIISAEELDKNSRSAKKPLNRPAMQIYRPPGLRSGGGESGAASSGVAARPKPAAGTKPLDTKVPSANSEENNNIKSSDSSGSRASSRASPRSEDMRLARTTSSLSSDSLKSQKSGSGCAKSGNSEAEKEKKVKLPSPPKKQEVKKRVMSEKEIQEAAANIRSLGLSTNTAEVEQFIAGCFTSEELGECVGSALCQHAIEGGGGRNVAKLCGSLKDTAAVKGLVRGLLTSVSQYFDCRDRLRADHFRMWIAFLNFVSDFYSSLGVVDGDISGVVFEIFNYLLKPPVLEGVKIEELECLISTLLSIGYDLERECPDQLALLKDLIRDAFIDVTEPWARKMILLLLELGASGWKLPPEANEYYFQQSSN